MYICTYNNKLNSKTMAKFTTDLNDTVVTIGDTVTVSPFLTRDFAKKKGQTGQVTAINEHLDVFITFEDGTVAQYGEGTFTKN